jgi:sugar O-acyltransferase (sialic acid O-acetyltransferase NeuD family)
MTKTKQPLIIFGTGKISEAVSYYFNRDSMYQISAYVIDDLYFKSDTFLNKPVVKLSDVHKHYNPQEYCAFVALGYQGINKLRSEKYVYLKNVGYSFASYRSPNVPGEFSIGENTIIMDGAAIQPFAQFANNVFVWGGAMIGHHAIIHDNCWLTGGCQIGGSVNLGEGTFVGMGAIIGQEVKTGVECMIGAGTLIIRSIGDMAVVVEQQTEIHRLNSQQFTRMSSCFRV